MSREERERVGISPQVRACIDATSYCDTACTETLTYSLDSESDLFDQRHLRLLIDCCEVCQTTQNILLRASELSVMLSAVCAEACEKVAAHCRHLDSSDEQLDVRSEERRVGKE